MTEVFAVAAIILLAYMACMFLIGLKARDNSLIDIAYGPAFIAACWGAWLLGPETSRHPRTLLLLVLVGLWGVRLGLHIGLRHKGRGEDFRYRKFREDWGDTIVWRSFLQIYMLQGAVVWLVSLPVLLVLDNPGEMLGWRDLLGFLLFTLGFLFEAVGDWQLVRFKRHPGNSGRIITHGLWRLSRHPNYFGEAVLWWGIFLIGSGAPAGVFGVISPLTINFLLLKVSGIPMLEEKYRCNPEFEVYRARTNAFFPWFPRRSQHHTARDSERK